MSLMNQHSQAAAAQAASANPLFDDWSGPFGVPPFGRSRAATFPACLRARVRRPRGRGRGHRRRCRRADLREHHRRARNRRRRAHARVQRLLSPRRGRTPTTRSRRWSANWRRSRPSTGTGFSWMRACSAASMRCIAGARSSASPRSRCGCSIATTRGTSARARRSTPPRKRGSADINERLATLGTTFSQNVLADEQGYTLVLDGEDDLAGLPDFVRAAAQAAAEERGLAGKHVITLSRSSVEPFLQFSAAPRSAREDLSRLDRARRRRRRDRQQGDHCRDGGAARRARAAARLSDVRPLPARRRHGQDPGGGAFAARARVAARAQPRHGRSRRAAGPGAG